MLAENSQLPSTSLKIPHRKRNRLKYVILFAMVALVLSGVFLLDKESLAVIGFSTRAEDVKFVSIDQGEIVVQIVETGTVESANNTTIRCEVEAILGKVGGTTTQQGAGAAGATRTGTTTTGGSSSGSSMGSTGGAGAGGASAKAKGASATGASGSGTAGSTSGSSSTSIASSSTSTGSSSTGTTSTTLGKPVIRSFSYQLARYTPMRGATVKAATGTMQNSAQGAMGGGGNRGGGGGNRGGGGGGRGGGGGNRGGGGMEEKLGSTRIIWILPEGSQVKTGELVCELDSAAFSDELQAQRIRYVQAQAFVEQVQSVLDVNEITLREYRDGVHPQDRQLILQYIETCEVQKEQAERTLTWSREVTQKGFRASAQLQADELNHQKTVIQLREAKGMLERLEKFTAPKLLKSLEANLEAIRADKLAQQIAFGLEEKRLKDLESNIKRCRLVAPHDGIVVYATQSNPWGRVTDRIEEGATVREGQPIFMLPDPLRMRVKAKVNETKVNLVQTGQVATIVADAFPEESMTGRVTEINPISVAGGMVSDVRVYFANINIDKGFANLRPGLSVEVTFHPRSQSKVRRVPLEAVRWVNKNPYVAFKKLETADAKTKKGASWAWRQVRLGMADTEYAEVLEGLEVGDRIVADPRALPEPSLHAPEPEPARVAAADAA